MQPERNYKYGQKLNPADVKTQPQDEFITQTNHDPAQAAEEMPVKPGAAMPDSDLEAQEIDEEGLEVKQERTNEGKADFKTGKTP